MPKKATKTLFFALRIVRSADNIVGRQLIKVAEQDQVIDFQLRMAVFDVAVALLGLMENFRDLCLGQIPVLANFTDSSAIIQAASPQVYRSTLRF